MLNKCEYCIGNEYCISQYTLSAWCDNMNYFRIFGKNYKDSKKILMSNLKNEDDSLKYLKSYAKGYEQGKNEIVAEINQIYCTRVFTDEDILGRIGEILNRELKSKED